MKRFLSYLVGILIFGCVFGIMSVYGIYIWFSKDLPSITKIDDYEFSETSTVYARDGSIMGYLYDEKRFVVGLEQVPKYTRDAFLAAEDANFYNHNGVDFKAILRALIANLKSGRNSQGGSTITQQVVKRFILNPEKNYERKIKEAILSYRLENHLSKDQILYLYLNEIFFGHNAYGIEAAARTYFGKHVEELTIAESAMLAGMPQKPSENNPYSNLDGALKRQGYVLWQMKDKGFITEQEYLNAVDEKLVYKQIEDPTLKYGAWYFEEVRRQLMAFLSEENVIAQNIPITKYGSDALYKGGIHIYTAMDPVYQMAAEEALRQGLYDVSKREGWKEVLQNLNADEYDNFFKKNPFTPGSLNDAGWAKGVIVEANKNEAFVKLGDYKGHISNKNLGWIKNSNNLNHVLKVGDVVWVSAYGGFGNKNPLSVPADEKNKIKKYDPNNITKETLIEVCLEQMPYVQGALVSVDIEKKDIVALVGGYNYSYQDQFNRATQAYRQTGSSFKPIVYSAALDHGYTANSIILDAPFVLAEDKGVHEWVPKNIDYKFLGPILFRTALVRSRNLCTIRIADNIGPNVVVDRAKALGIPGDIPPVLAISLGSYDTTPLAMLEAYTTFANGGKRFTPSLVHKITNRWGEDIVSFIPEEEQVITPQNAFIMTSMLSDVITSGTGGKARVLNRPIAGKTGTSNDSRDAWFIGYTPFISTSVFVGYDDNKPMSRGESGSRTALPIFVDYYKKIDNLHPKDKFPVPKDIVFASINSQTGAIAGAGSADSIVLPFVDGTLKSSIQIDDIKNNENIESIDLLKNEY